MAPTPQQLALIAKARRRRAEAEAQPAQSAPSNAPRTNIPARIGFEAGKAVKGFYDNARRPSTPEESAKLQAGFDERSADRRALASINMGSDGSYQTEGKDGLLRPSGYANPVDRDISKGITTSPIWGANAAIGAAESTLNLPSDTYNTFNNASAQPVSDAQAMRNVNRMPQLQARVGEDPRAAPKQAPIFDIPRVPMPEGMESVTAQIAEPIAQFILARKAIGKIPGFKGGPAIAHNAKDAAALGIGVSSQSRLSEMPEVQAYVQASGAPQFAKDFVGWLGETDPGNPLLRRGKLALEDFVLSSPFLIPGAVAAGKRAIDPALTPTNAGGARLGSQSPAAPQMAPGGAPQPQPSVAPVNAVPPTRPAQPGQSGAGQQPPGAPPTLNATPQAVPAQGGVALAKSDAKIIGRLIRSGGVAGNDVNNVLSGLVQAYNRSNGGRTRLALFAEDYLPTVLPREVADGVIEQLRNFGNAANTSVKDGRRAIIQRNVGELRGSQEDYLTGVFEENLGDTSLLTTKGKIRGDKTLNADAVYKQELDAGQQRLAAGQGTPKEEAARDKLLTMMGQKSFFARIPDELKQAAEGNDQGLWELIHQRPLEAAHWLQSKLGFLERKKMDPSAGLYAEMRRGLLRPLEDAVPGYRGARMRAGDLVGQEIATKFGDDLFRAAAGELSAGEKAADFKRLSKSQQTVAKRSIRDKLKNEFRKSKTATGPIDPATGKRLDTRAAYMQQLQKDGVLEVLEEILGPEGKNIADAIRAEARLNDQLPAYGSDSLKNFVGKEAAREAVQSPLNKVVGDIGDKGGWVQTAVGDALLMANGLPPVLTPGKIGAKIVDRFGNPSKKALASATETLYGRPPPNTTARPTNGLAQPARPPRAPPPRRPAVPVTQDLLTDLLNQYNAMNHGRAPVASERLAKRIVRVRKQLEAQAANPGTAPTVGQNALNQSAAPVIAAAPSPTNGLSSPPSPKGKRGPPKAPPEANGLFSRPKPEPQAPLVGGTPEANGGLGDRTFEHYDAIQTRLANERGRLGQAKTEAERKFREVQVSQAEKELASEIKFLESKGIKPPDEMSDEDLLAELLGDPSKSGASKSRAPTILPELGGAALSGTLAYNAQPEGTSDGERAASIALSAMFGAGLARPVANRLGPAMKAVAANKAATRAGRNGLDSNGLFGMGGNQPGLKSAAIRYKDASGRMQVLKGKDHVEIEALADKKFAGQDMDTERGFIGSDGKFVKDMDAALDALSAGQITDPKVRAIIEQQIKAGRTPVITSEMLDFSGKARPESNGMFGGGKPPNNVLPLKKGAANAPNDDITHTAHWEYKNPAGQRDSVQANFYDRGNGMLAIDVIWPSSVGDDLTDALVRRKNELNSKTKGLKVVDETFGKQVESSPDWATNNPTEAQRIVKTVADRVVGLSNGKTPAVVVHTLDGYDNELLLNLLKQGRNRNQTVLRTKDGGSSLAIVNREWLAQHPKEISPDIWEVAGETKDAGRWPPYTAPHPTSLPPGKYKVKGYEGGPWHVYDANGYRVSSPDMAFLDKAEAQDWLSKATGATSPKSSPAPLSRKPPESNGFFPRSGAEPNALKAAPKSQRRSGISIPRALVGGAVGGVMGAEADPQTADIQARMQGVNDRIAKIEREIAATESALKIYDTGSPKEVQAQLLRDGFDWVKQDEVIGPQTSRAIAEKRKQNTAEIAQKRADIEAERGRLKDLETQAAYAETAPSDAIKVLREAGPIGGAIAGLVLGALSRGGAVKSVAKKAAAQTNKLNALLTPGPVATPRSAANSNALARRAANVNEFWRLGGAGENVPFSTNGKGEWRPRSKAASPSSLFPSKTGIMKGGDYGVIASALAESGLATVAQQAAQQEIKAAQAAVDKNPTKENLERLENAKTIEAIATSAQRLGLALAGARATAALKMPYTAMRPDIGAAESERALILQAVRRAKPK